MINLLPPGTRQDIMYARRNTKLMHWAIALVVGLVGIVVVVMFGYFYIDQSTQSMDKQSQQAQVELKDLKLEETKKRVEDLSSSIKLVTQVLSKQVLLSELLQQVGAVMPSGSSLSSLTVNKFEGGIDLSVQSKDYHTATQIQVNLQDPNNKIFDKVDIININCGASSPGSPYPCTGTYRALFAKENPFMFLKKAATP